jgi:hypothetical protein
VGQIRGILINILSSILEIATVILCVFTFSILVEECQTWDEFEDVVLCLEEAAAMNPVHIQLAAMKVLRAATWVSGLQTILTAVTLFTCSKIFPS